MKLAKVQIWIRDCFLQKPKPFTHKRDVNWSAVKKFATASVGTAVLVLLLIPAPKAERNGFHEPVRAGSSVGSATLESDPSAEALSQMARSQAAVRLPSASLDSLYLHNPGRSAGGGNDSARASSMILSRAGGDSKAQLPAGTRIAIQLLDRAVVSSQAVPVIARVVRDSLVEGVVAIPENAKVYGEVRLDEGTDRVQVSWHEVELPGGRRRPLAAMGLGADEQLGLDAPVQSEALKNTVGQTLTRFIGAYAEGAMERGAFGGSAGGVGNGLKNGVAETAKQRSETWAQGLQKERKWVELEAGHESWAVLSQPFLFRNPGSLGGSL